MKIMISVVKYEYKGDNAQKWKVLYNNIES